MPPITPTEAESAEYTRIMNDINTYIDEMSVRFLVGSEPISNFDNFVQTIYSMGIERAIDIYQGAYERYQSR